MKKKERGIDGEEKRGRNRERKFVYTRERERGRGRGGGAVGNMAGVNANRLSGATQGAKISVWSAHSLSQ